MKVGDYGLERLADSRQFLGNSRGDWGHSLGSLEIWGFYEEGAAEEKG